MATKAKVVLYDDMTGDEIAEGDGDTVHFGLGNQQYEIELSLESQSKFYDTIGYWRDHARKVQVHRVSRPAASRRESTHVREWAIDQGLLALNQDRGRIPEEVHAAYKRAHQ